MKKLLLHIVICLEILLLVSYSSPTLVAETREDASQILSQALQVATTIERTHLKTKGLALAKIAGKYAESGEYDQALQVATSIEEASSKALALAKIAGKMRNPSRSR